MIVELIGLFISIAIYIVIAVPLNGALVRLRANFNPKSIQLDAEGNVEPHTGPVVTSFFGMLRRVKRIEVSPLWIWSAVCRSSCSPSYAQGWAGLYKGLSMWSTISMKTLITHLFFQCQHYSKRQRSTSSSLLLWIWKPFGTAYEPRTLES